MIVLHFPGTTTFWAARGLSRGVRPSPPRRNDQPLLSSISVIQVLFRQFFNDRRSAFAGVGGQALIAYASMRMRLKATQSRPVRQLS